MDKLILTYSNGLNGADTHGVYLGGVYIGSLTPVNSATGQKIGYNFTSPRGYKDNLIFASIKEFEDYVISKSTVTVSDGLLFAVELKAAVIELNRG